MAEKPFGIIKYYRRPNTMEKNIEAAVKAYSGDVPTGLFVDKLPNNLRNMNVLFQSIEQIFKNAGIVNFEKLPADNAAIGKFAKEFNKFVNHLEAAIIQGFTWSKSNLRSRLMDLSSLTPDKQVKLQYWLDVIRQCRASGLTNQIWCEQHDISLKSYYYWLSKIRKLALEELPRKKNGIHMCTDQQSTALTESPAEFAELSLPDRNISRSTPAAILHIGSITVELYEGTSAQMLENILKAVQSC